MFVYYKASWILGGRRAEQRADNFAVDLGYGKGVLMTMKCYIEHATNRRTEDIRKRLSELLSDNHPGSVTRYKRALRRIKHKR